MSANLLDVFTSQAMLNYGHLGSAEHYRRLKNERKLYATQCESCEHTAYPARSFCPKCMGDQVSWVAIGDGAKLFAFTTQKRALRFTAPAVIGVVDIPGVGFVVTPIGGTYDELEIGQSMRLEVVDLSDELTIHTFVPA